MAIFILFTFCIQNISFASAQELLPETGSGTYSTDPLPQEEPTLPIELPAATGAQLPFVPLSLSPLLIRITEVCWMGSEVSTADEWLEIAAIPQMTGSVLTQPLNLDGWTVSTVKDGTETVLARFTSAHSIASGGYLVIANFSASQSRLRSDPALVASSMSLPNTKLLLRLRNAAGELMDEVDDGIGVPFAGANPSGGIKASMERVSIRMPGTMQQNWRAATTQRGLDSIATLHATPGYENGTIEPPDTTPPLEVNDLRAFLLSGSVLAAWAPSTSSDVASQELTLFDRDRRELSKMSLGIERKDGVFQVSGVAFIQLRVTDEASHTSTGVVIPVQPLLKPIIDEVLPDPVGADAGEWIEIANPYDTSLNLTGWSLQSGAKSFVFSQSGGVLQPGERRMLFPLQTGLTLPNAGGQVRVMFLGMRIDELSYSALPEGISYGRLEDATNEPLCTAQPAQSNTRLPPKVVIDGLIVPGASTLNLSARALSGSLAGAACYWEFGDGFTYTGCNPPSHSMKQSGERIISLKVTDYCGTTVLHTQSVFVNGKTKSSMQKMGKNLCTVTHTHNLQITEFFPAPVAGEEEWIELHNTGTGSVSLCGWSIDDEEGGSKPFSLPASQLDPGAHLVIRGVDSKIALNNDQDHVRLLGPLPGGGTGVVLQLSYQNAQSDSAYALRADGQWLWTPYQTPGSENRFTEVDRAQPAPIVILSAVLPNPQGIDTASEWIEVQNLTMRPQWLSNWSVETASGKSLSLSGTVLARHQTVRIPLKESFTLGNSKDSLRLLDEQGRIRSVLAWNKAKDGQVIYVYEGVEPLVPDRAMVLDGLSIRSAYVMEGEKQPTYLTTNLAGIHTLENANNFEVKNIFSALIKNKKIELKSDSYGPAFYVYVDGVEVAPLLLQMGYVYVATDVPFDRSDEYLVYENEARRNKRGMWATEDDAHAIDTLRSNRILDNRVEEEGLLITVDVPSGLVSSGTTIHVSTNAPAELLVKVGSGSVQSFSGSMVIVHDVKLQFTAIYTSLTSSGSNRTTVATREYTMVKDYYEPCIAISEVYPSPLSGENEWVELLNRCSTEVNLLGWAIDDEPERGSKKQLLGTGMTLLPHSHIVLSGSNLKVTLNNGGDGVNVVMPNGRMSDSLWYPSVKKGRSYAYEGADYCLSDTVTPGASNICSIKNTAKKSPVKAKKLTIGLKTAFTFATSFIIDSSTKIDLGLSLYEGLNEINKYKNNKKILVTYMGLILLMILACVLVSISLKKYKNR